ncbi:tripartite tricarboxylate transporter substrate binding protein [Pantoea sp. 18069]|uniref:Bug family tripartite tricarboxylate transporter substrate binding protein n=1 Tax=Pantoea sp. 18069 TaxID=2681415 RepID=UPI00135CE4E5|nr:tripartite tricarboxylate transporter substrate binding protein [Pantoea sp. 18069]
MFEPLCGAARTAPVNAGKRRLFQALAACGLMLGTPLAFCQDWPARPIKIVVPFPAGGTTDLLARLIAPPMSQELGQPVVIENRPGAGSLLGADLVAKAAPDGYTLLMGNISVPLAALVAERAKRLTFDPVADFQGVSIVAGVPLVITANPSVDAKDLKGFLNLARNDAGTHYVYGSTGPGSYLHVVGEWLQQETKTSLTHVPFKGAAPLKQEMLAGRIHMGGDQLSTSLPDIRAGSLKPLAVTSPARSPSLPEVPTVRELGLAGIETEGWNGLLAPTKTPRDVVQKIQQSVLKAVKSPALQQRMAALAAEPRGSSPAEQTELLNKQLAQFRPMVAQLKLD